MVPEHDGRVPAQLFLLRDERKRYLPRSAAAQRHLHDGLQDEQLQMQEAVRNMSLRIANLQSPLSYDREIRIARRWALALGLFNLGLALLGLYQHNWILAAAAGVWAACCRLWRKILVQQQITRETLRQIEISIASARRVETGDW
jgi:hypothetical protein